MKRRSAIVALILGFILLGLYGYRGLAKGGGAEGQSLAAPAAAAAAASWNSWPFLMNTSMTATATVNVSFYAQDGTLKGTAANTIAPNSSWFVPVWSLTALGDGFKGSAVVSSDYPLVAITNLVNGADSAAASYNGDSTGGATTLIAPAIHARNYNWYSELFVQNTSASASTLVTVTFTPQPGSTGTGRTITDTIPANASHSYKAGDYTTGDFVGSAKVESSGGIKVSGAVTEWNTGPADQILAYNAVPPTAASTELYFPSQHNNNYGWNAYNFISNPDPSNSAVITGTWFDNVGTQVAVVTKTVPAGGSNSLFTYEHLGTTNYFGSLKVTASRAVIGITNEATNVRVLSYNAFPASAGTTKVLFPSQHNNDYGWWTYNYVQNAGNVTGTLTATWRNTSGATVATDTAPVGPGRVASFFTYSKLDPQDFVGSLVVESNGPAIVGIANEVNGLVTAYDASMAYSGINQ